MNIRQNLSPIIGAIAVLFMIGPAYTADLDKAKGTVDNIREADPPKQSTTTKKSPAGLRADEFKPKGPSVKPKAPPPPPRNLNPRNDPDVQKGIDDYGKGKYR